MKPPFITRLLPVTGFDHISQTQDSSVSESVCAHARACAIVSLLALRACTNAREYSLSIKRWHEQQQQQQQQ